MAMNGQHLISQYNISTMLCDQVMRIKTIVKSHHFIPPKCRFFPHQNVDALKSKLLREQLLSTHSPGQLYPHMAIQSYKKIQGNFLYHKEKVYKGSYFASLLVLFCLFPLRVSFSSAIFAQWCMHEENESTIFYLYGYPWYLERNTDNSKLKNSTTRPKPTITTTESGEKW